MARKRKGGSNSERKRIKKARKTRNGKNGKKERAEVPELADSKKEKDTVKLPKPVFQKFTEGEDIESF